ncbi:MAG: hypothetical protein CXT69_02005 [Methanobacteriota archaeon]|nr:MAG: hypothetical protein CXT69_02005 [Euryarchaeota archaeon]
MFELRICSIMVQVLDAAEKGWHATDTIASTQQGMQSSLGSSKCLAVTHFEAQSCINPPLLNSKLRCAKLSR